MGAYELFFTRGPVFAGIHEGEDRHAAEKLAAMLEARLSEEKQ
jgi:hypothetical protein